jgi:predicted secreted Zn-dependent protease
VAAVQYTFTHKQYTEQHNETEYTEQKIKLKVKVTLEQATKAQRGSRGIALLFP